MQHTFHCIEMNLSAYLMGGNTIVEHINQYKSIAIHHETFLNSVQVPVTAPSIVGQPASKKDDFKRNRPFSLSKNCIFRVGVFPVTH